MYYDTSNTSDDENENEDDKSSENKVIPLIEEGRTRSGRAYREAAEDQDISILQLFAA